MIMLGQEEIMRKEIPQFLIYQVKGIEIIKGIIGLWILMILFRGKGRR